MLEAITDWFSEIDGNIVGISVIMWAVCLIMIWKFFDSKFMTLPLKIVVTIIALPMCWGIVYLFSEK